MKILLALLWTAHPALALPTVVMGYEAHLCRNGAGSLGQMSIDGLIKIVDPKFQRDVFKDITDPDSIQMVIRELDGSPANIGNRIEKIFNHKTDLWSFLSENPEGTYRDYVKFLVQTTAQQANDLRKMANSLGKEIKTLELRAEEVPAEKSEIQNRIRKLLNLKSFLNITADKISISKMDRFVMESAPDGALNTRTFRSDYPRAEYVVRQLRSALTELEVAIRVPDPTWMDMIIGRGNIFVPRDHADRLVAQMLKADPALTDYNARGLLKREIDIEFKGGSAWAEVKYSNYVLDADFITGSRSERNDQSVLAQARRTAYVARLLGKEYHLYVLNGITAEAAKLLKDQGVIVHGTIIAPGDINH